MAATIQGIDPSQPASQQNPPDPQTFPTPGIFESSLDLRNCSAYNKISEQAFMDTSIQVVKFPITGLTNLEIGHYAFYGCDRLNEIHISSIHNINIGRYAFYACTNLHDIYFHPVGNSPINYNFAFRDGWCGYGTSAVGYNYRNIGGIDTSGINIHIPQSMSVATFTGTQFYSDLTQNGAITVNVYADMEN